jgi:alpha-ketoglutarate-dependent taurine dioxygenase
MADRLSPSIEDRLRHAGRTPAESTMNVQLGRAAANDGYRTISVTPLSPVLAADIDAGDLRELTDQRFAEIRRAWLAYHVIRFRGQDFTNADMIAFGRRFGEFQPNVERGRDAAYPQVSFISNLVENERPLGMLGDGEFV